MENSVDNVRSQMRKGVLEYCILCILNRKEAYASSILEDLKSANMIVVEEARFYPLLIRQKNQGLLSYRWRNPRRGSSGNITASPRRSVSSSGRWTRPGRRS